MAIVVWSDGVERDPNYPGNPDPSDPIPVWNWDMNEADLADYRARYDAWLKRHHEFDPGPGFS